jgi:hypothetical protein
VDVVVCGEEAEDASGGRVDRGSAVEDDKIRCGVQEAAEDIRGTVVDKPVVEGSKVGVDSVGAGK